jgi:MFS family permease
MFPEPGEQAKAIGVYAFVASAGGSIGLLVGGALTQAIDWHWIFFVNVPIGITTAFFARRLLHPENGIGLAKGADVTGAGLITAALMLGVYTIVKPAAEYGWGAGRTLAFGAASLVLLVAFVARESRAPNPLIPLRIFRSRNVAGANAIQALTVAGMFGMFFIGSLYLRQVLGYGALEVGLAFMPTTLIMGALSVRYSERLITRYGPRTTLIPGLVLMAVGLVLFTRTPINGRYLPDVLPTLVLLGAGVGLSVAALMTLAMSGATPSDAGLASGLVNTTAQVGGALGLAVLNTLAATRTHGLLVHGAGTASALTAGYHRAYLIAGLLVVAAIAVAGAVLTGGPRRAHAPQPASGEACPETA